MSKYNMNFTPVLLFAVILYLSPFTQGRASPRKSHTLDVYLIKETPSRLRVIWFVREGDLKFVDKFQFTVTSETGKKLIDSKLARIQRSVGLKPISDDVPYTITIKALEEHGLPIAEKEVHVRPASAESILEGDEKMFFVVDEIRPKQARLAWALNNVDVTEVKNIRLHIEKRGKYSGEPVVITRMLSPSKRTFQFSRIPHSSRLCVTVEAIGQDGNPFLNSAIYFEIPDAHEIPESGWAGQPVNGSALPLTSLLDDCCNKCRWPPLLIDPN